MRALCAVGATCRRGPFFPVGVRAPRLDRNPGVGRGVGPYLSPATQTIHVTSDGGTTWQANAVSVGPELLGAAHFPTRLEGFAVGRDHVLKLTPDRAASMSPVRTPDALAGFIGGNRVENAESPQT